MNELLQRHLEEKIKNYLGEEHRYVWKQIGGGSINTCHKIIGGQRNFFVKSNDVEVFKNGFLEEKQGLLFLKNKGLRVPEVIEEGYFQNQIYLLLEWIDSGNKTSSFWQDFAEQLTMLHRNKNEFFGLDITNYMGQLIQENSLKNDFNDFFTNNRIKPQVEMAFNKGLLRKNHLQNFENFYFKLPGLFPKEAASAVHGDLWSGNFICGPNNTAVFIDPAVYYGHREVDLSMSLLFGGFAPEFYKNYQDLFPLEPGFNNRVDYYNLYPLLIHLNLFGSSYLGQIEGIVSQF